MASTSTIIERKLVPPAARAGLVPREHLLTRLRANRSVPVIAIAAPPGYGKSTLLAQWIAGDDRPAAWVSLDARNSDPVQLLRYLASALDRVEPMPEGLIDDLERSDRVYDASLPRFLAAVGSMRTPLLVALDDAQALTAAASRDLVGELCNALPEGSQLAVASRDLPPLPLGRLRAQGRLLEFGTDDLALTDEEAGALLREAGLVLLPNDIVRLAERTEGWAAGLYLAALSIQASGSTAAIHATFGGTDRFVTDFLRSELLARLDPDDLDFQRRTSVLGDLCGPLVDAVLETTGAALRLERLERSNLFVVPLDRSRTWYRYHTLFRELLAHELRTDDPGAIGDLLGRTADWYAANDLPEQAMTIALDAGDHDRAAQIFADHAFPMWWQGRVSVTIAWIRQFGDALGRYPDAATAGALLAILHGDGPRARRLLDAVDRVPPSGRFASVADVARGLLFRGGPQAALAATTAAVAAAPPDSLFRAQALVPHASALEAMGDDAAAEAALAEVTELPAGMAAAPARSIALALRARRAMDAGNWAAAEVLVRRARSVVATGHLDEYSTTVAVEAVAARMAIRRGDLGHAREELVRAQRLRRVLTDASPWFTVDARIELGRAYLALGDTAGARTVLAEADEIRKVQPDLGTLTLRLEDLRARVAAAPSGPAGFSTLTPAELRLLPYLPTHLSFGEIASRFDLSPNTVKTQAGSIYAKFDVGSRTEAVDRAREIGLLEH